VKNLMVFVRKEMLHILRDPKSLLIMILLPLVEILLFGFVLRFEINSANIAVYDMAKQTKSIQLVQRLEGGKRFQVIVANSMPEAEAMLLSGEVKAILTIGADFDQKAVAKMESPLQLLLDASDPNLASTLNTYLSATINDFWAENYPQNHLPIITELSQNGDPTPTSPSRHLATSLTIEPMLYYNPLLKSVYATIPGLISVVLMLICALMTSISLTREKETGTMNVLLISPLNPLQIIIGKLLPYLLVSMLNVAIILTLAFTVFGMPLAGSFTMLILVSLLYCLCALALGFLISTKAKTQQLAMMVSLAGLMLPTTLLSGMIYPIQNMPTWLQNITLAIPARWYVSILKHIMIKGSPIAAYGMDIFVLIFITGIIIALSLKSFKIRFR
jgi:ABC-2 type transport system permease protein